MKNRKHRSKKNSKRRSNNTKKDGLDNSDNALLTIIQIMTGNFSLSLDKLKSMIPKDVSPKDLISILIK